MQRRVGHAVIESIAAEIPKFTAPMLLVHGLWCTAAVWRTFMGYFAHRGWTCHALNLRGRAAPDSAISIGRVRFADYLEDVRGVIAACDAPPIVVGHDLGGLLALHCVAREARAVVALAPLVPRPIATVTNPTLSGFSVRFAMLRSHPLPAPRDRIAAHCFAQGAPGGIVRDSGRVAHQLRYEEFQLPAVSGAPTFVLAGERDPFCPPADVERLAARVGATFRMVAGAGHALPWEPGWERRVSEIHRWLIQTLGEDLLMRDEEETEDV